jgi:hypothetical protein
MVPPLGVSYDSRYICKYKKAIYSLNQASHAWFEKFSIVISSLRFVLAVMILLFFVKRTDAGHIILSLYIDDMIITGLMVF